MKLDLSTELRKRVATGLVGAALLILLIVFGGWIGICFLTAVISLGMVNEFCHISFSQDDRLIKRYLLLIVTWLVMVVNLLIPRLEFELLTLAFLALFGHFLFTAKEKGDDAFVRHFQELKFSLFGLVYLVFMPLYLTRIHDALNGVHWTILFFLMVWAGDSIAYFTGRRFGKRKLYPEISPKKTVEGAYGGLAGGVLIALLYKVLFFHALGWLGVVLVPIVVGAMSQVGDLCESFLKRAYGVKDSGSTLPGHGGFLDRFDGVVFSLPVMYACTRLFG